MEKQFNLLGFHLLYDGLTASYQIGEDYDTLNLCPFETCQLLQDAGLIEGFTQDEKTCEPIILFTDITNPQGFNGDYWGSFLRSFPFDEQICSSLIQYQLDRKQSQSVQTLINALLSPLVA
ncbi:MAG: hypothetical protein EOP48_14555 [Sphingobacteriales bacterium]|nr:MAG: hypothetical protein EOP48_14555 [Sphingobacteriales bacterium]